MATEISNSIDENIVLQALKIYQIYQNGKIEVVALKGLDLELNKGEMLTIVGPSGAGKSSLLNILGGIQRPSAGVVYYNGIDITKLSEEELVTFRRKKVGFIFQEGNLLPFQNAFENVENTLRFLGESTSNRQKLAKELLRTVGLGHRMNHIPSKMSGGERQRVAIARALSSRPSIVLADEPTGNLDQETSTQILDLFKELNKDTGIAFLIVTHDKLVASYSTRSLELRDGMIIGQHGSGLNLSDLETTRLTRIDEEGRLPVPKTLLKEITDELKSPVVLWKSKVLHLKSEFENEGKEQIPSLVFSPIFEDGIKSHKRQVDNKICPVCGNVLPPNALFCLNCGAKFI